MEGIYKHNKDCFDVYINDRTTTDTDVIFLGTDNKPIDGSELPRGYSIVGSFKNNQDMGIWVSKYQPSVN